MSRSAANAKGDAIGICRHYFSCTLFRKVGNVELFFHPVLLSGIFMVAKVTTVFLPADLAIYRALSALLVRVSLSEASPGKVAIPILTVRCPVFFDVYSKIVRHR